MASVPVAEGLFTWPSDEPQLIGSRCAACGICHVPNPGLVPTPAASTEMETQLLRGGARWQSMEG